MKKKKIKKTDNKTIWQTTINIYRSAWWEDAFHEL